MLLRCVLKSTTHASVTSIKVCRYLPLANANPRDGALRTAAAALAVAAVSSIDLDPSSCNAL